MAEMLKSKWKIMVFSTKCYKRLFLSTPDNKLSRLLCDELTGFKQHVFVPGKARLGDKESSDGAINGDIKYRWLLIKRRDELEIQAHLCLLWFIWKCYLPPNKV